MVHLGVRGQLDVQGQGPVKAESIAEVAGVDGLAVEQAAAAVVEDIAHGGLYVEAGAEPTGKVHFGIEAEAVGYGAGGFEGCFV